MRSGIDINPADPGNARLLIRWARRYAKSRTISFLVQWAVIVFMVTAIGVAAQYTDNAYRAGDKELFYIAVSAMIAVMVFLIWFSISPWGGEMIWRVTQWLYGKEGYAAYTGQRHDGPSPWWLTALGGGLIAYHLLGALLVGFRYLTMVEMQPFSAAYMTPYIVILIFYQRLGFWAWAWPILYALHAIFILCDVPIRPIYLGSGHWEFVSLAIRGRWQLLNMAVPVFGYGFIAILTGHIYSRFALWKLKRLARAGLDPNAPIEDADGGEKAP